MHIWIEKTDPTNTKSAEFAYHKDTENAIPAGDAFGFAELHYKQNGEELLKTLNREMFLHIGEERGFYYKRKTLVIPEKPLPLVCPQSPLFSFFKAPISNTKTA